MAAGRIDEVRWRTVSPRAIGQGDEGSDTVTQGHVNRLVTAMNGRAAKIKELLVRGDGGHADGLILSGVTS
jgi:hypothetical protein